MAKGKYEQWLTPEGLTLLQGWARQGLSDEQIAHNIGISRKTLSAWKVKYGDIGDKLKKGKAVADFEVENALFKRATGFNTVDETEELIDGAGLMVTKRVKKYVPPDTAAMIYWLKVRDPKHWQERPYLVNPEDADTLDDGLLEAIRKSEPNVWSDDDADN